MRPSYADQAPYPTAPSTDPADAATTVFSIPATAPWDLMPAPPAVLPAAGDQRAIHRRFTTTTAKGNTVVSAGAALGAVVTGGLLASQVSTTAALADPAPFAPDTSMSATAMASLLLQPDSSEAPLPTSDTAAAYASPAILPVPNTPDASLGQREIEDLHKGDTLARQASAFHAAAAREAGILNGGGNLDDWITVALQKLGMDQAMAPGVKRIILEESRGNPGAVNRWDSNAMAGRPSQGLMQVIPSTFRTYVLPELANRPITDPVANITAGIRYMLANYGSATLRAGGRYSSGGYVGY